MPTAYNIWLSLSLCLSHVNQSATVSLNGDVDILVKSWTLNNNF